jgi:2-hydroxychromene-2-carboxylate isomerase
MVMRGVPATMAKGRYIMTDTAREADAYGIPFGDLYDPIGAPVRRAYSLYPWARSMNREIEFLSSFLVNAFSRGVNAANNRGLRQIVEFAGLSWSEGKKHLDTNQWVAEIEENQRVLVDEQGLWGVPSFRLRNAEGNTFCTWGQDRIWLVAAEMKRLMGQ